MTGTPGTDTTRRRARAVAGPHPDTPALRTGGEPIRVLLVADKLGFRDVKLHGTGRLIIEWTRAFDPARVAITTCVLRGGGALEAELRREGIPITFLGHTRFDPRTLPSLIAIMRRQRIDLLHLNGYGSSTLGRIAGQLLGTPAIVHVHGDQFSAPAGYPMYVRAIDHVLARWTARAISVSESTRTFCEHGMGFRSSQVEVVHNPTPKFAAAVRTEEDLAALRRRSGLSAHQPLVGVASRLYPVKGHRTLLEAFARVLARVPSARLLVVGDGPERERLEARALDLGIAHQVHFVGFQEDVLSYLRLCQVTAIPSVGPEPFGLVAVESFAAGVPVIASRIGGLPEIITDGVAGFLVEPGNPVALARALLRVLEDPALHARLAGRAVAESERFSMDHFVRRMERIYREVLAEAAARRGGSGRRKASPPQRPAQSTLMIANQDCQ